VADLEAFSQQAGGVVKGFPEAAAPCMADEGDPLVQA